jgi:hypothetical protein
MNCTDCKELMIEYIEGLLDESQKQAVSEHLKNCRTCQAEMNELTNIQERLVNNGKKITGSNLENKVMDNIVREQNARLKTAAKAGSALNLRRKIMRSPITKIAAAAVIIISISLIGFFSLNRDNINDFSFLAKAFASEDALFTGKNIIHIENKIIVFAPTENSNGLDSTWLPMCSLKADGKFMYNQLKLPVYEKQYIVYDNSWYEPATGKFIRILKTDDKVVFANSYDGKIIYTSQTDSDGNLKLNKEAITEDFRPPLKPAEFLGMGAGLQSGLGQDTSMLRDISEGKLEDGSSAKIYKVGTPDPSGKLPAYWLFIVSDDDGTIAEEEYVISDEPRLSIRRILAETVLTAEYSWNLSEIEGSNVTADAGPQISITPDMVITDVSVQHMVERANFETYFFTVNPSWTEKIQIIDVIDPASPGGRMFIFASRANDGRHLVMVQSPSYNTMIGPLAKTGTLVYTSPNGFKVWGGGQSKWYAEILLNSAKFVIKDPPSDNRTGYILESPAGTFPALAINGPLSDEELHKLIDSLVPAKNYIKK